MKPRVGLLMGDPSGIGPEIIVKLLSRAKEHGEAKVVVIGERWAVEEAQRIVGVKLELAQVTSSDQFETSSVPAIIETNFLQPNELVPGCATAQAGAAVIKSLRLAIDLVKKGSIDAVCYAPLNKQAMHLAGLQFPDELRLFAHELGHTGDSGEINVLGNAWTSRVTSHVPLSEVPRLITTESIQKAIRLIHHTMKKSGIGAPRIAVAALNPHAGEGGNFGREEIDVIRPTILKAAANGLNVDGPFPSDTVFLKLKDGLFDAVVTMYHDQGQIAMKLMGFHRGVTVSGGLPISITTPAHGTAFDIVGQNRADVGAMIEAFKLAIRLAGCSQGVSR
jgi:4-hydroxythreonine-4-phosphate dehydrogenase